MCMKNFILERGENRVALIISEVLDPRISSPPADEGLAGFGGERYFIPPTLKDLLFAKQLRGPTTTITHTKNSNVKRPPARGAEAMEA